MLELGITEDTTTREVGEMIKAMTARARCSLAEMRAGAVDSKTGRRAFANATVFVSGLALSHYPAAGKHERPRRLR